jgi:signal transduction histidine kinase
VEFPVSFTFQIYLNYSTDSADYDRLAWVVYGIFVIYISLIIVSSIIYSRITVKRFASPLKKLTSYMERLEKGDYEEREVNSNLYEFNSLQKGFNKLAIELKKQESMRQEMQENRDRLFRDISHDLKNPLASIQGYIELYLNKKDMTKETQDKYLGIIYNNSIRANLLINSLFQFAQVNSSEFKLDMKQIDVCELLRSKIATFIPVFEERNFIYEINIPAEDIICMLDVVQMNRVFDNLFDNAIKYNEDGTHITITIFKTNHFVHIEISDNGIGIDEKDTEALFEPFVRADENVRNSQTGGSGLGLAIVKRIVELHNGEIKLVSQIRKGCKFILIFPI